MTKKAEYLPRCVLTLDEREFATVLAGLRFWQKSEADTIDPAIEDIASNGGALTPLSASDIDALCERLNCDPVEQGLRDALEEIAGSGLTDDGAEQARSIAVEALKAAVLPEPRFMFSFEPHDEHDAQFVGLAKMAEDNKEDEEFVAWLKRARPGEAYRNGGGAMPIVVTWRVA